MADDFTQGLEDLIQPADGGMSGYSPPASGTDPFDELDSEFKTKYGRALRFTGRDTPTHIRLHGAGQARDIGVREMSADELKFVLKRGPELGLNLRDFSKALPHSTSTGVRITGPHVHAQLGGKQQAPAADFTAGLGSLIQPAGAQEDTSDFTQGLEGLILPADGAQKPLQAPTTPTSPVTAPAPDLSQTPAQASPGTLKTPSLTTDDLRVIQGLGYDPATGGTGIIAPKDRIERPENVKTDAARTIEQMLNAPDVLPAPTPPAPAIPTKDDLAKRRLDLNILRMRQVESPLDLGYKEAQDSFNTDVERYNKSLPRGIVGQAQRHQKISEAKPGAVSENVDVSSGEPMSEGDLYGQWDKARASGDLETTNAIGKNYLEQFPNGKYAKYIASSTKQFTPKTVQADQQPGAGAYIPVKDIETMRRQGMKDPEILKAIQDSAARQIGLSDSDVTALTAKYGQHPLANITEPGTNSRSSINSIIKQGKSNGGLAEFDIQSDTLKSLHADRKTFKPEAVMQEDAVRATHAAGAKEFLSNLADDPQVNAETPEIAFAAKYLSGSPQILKLMSAISSGGLEVVSGQARMQANVSSLFKLTSFANKLNENADELADMAANLARSSGDDYASVRKASKMVISLLPIMLAAETGSLAAGAIGESTSTGTTLALATYGAAEKAHEGPKAAIMNAALLSGPYFVMAKSGLAPAVEEWVAGKLGPTAEMAEAALAAGTKQEAINGAASLLRQKLIAESLGKASAQTTNLAQFIATSAAIHAAGEGRAMTKDELLQSALVFAAVGVPELIRGAATIPGEVAGRKAGAERATFGESIAAEGNVVDQTGLGGRVQEGKQIGPGEEPPVPLNMPHRVGPPGPRPGAPSGEALDITPEVETRPQEEPTNARETTQIQPEGRPTGEAHRPVGRETGNATETGQVGRVRNRAKTEVAVAEKQAPLTVVDEAAHEAAMSPRNELPEPSQAQQEAGNYRKGHVKVAGLDISIENPQGSTRSGVGPDGEPWSRELHSHYGYIKRSEGADGEQVDVFIKPGTREDYSGPVFVVNQDDEKATFDEHKAMLGFTSRQAAVNGYVENYDPGAARVGSVAKFKDPAEFKQWLNNADLKKPAKESTLGAVRSIYSNEKGEPITVYHGSPHNFAPGEVPSPQKAQGFGTGIYFATDEAGAAEHTGRDGRRPVAYRLRISKPLINGSTEYEAIIGKVGDAYEAKHPEAIFDSVDSPDAADLINAEIRKQGYDAIITPEHGQYGNEIVVFDKSQVVPLHAEDKSKRYSMKPEHAAEVEQFKAAETEAERMAVEARAKFEKQPVTEGHVVTEEPARVTGTEGIVKRARENERRATEVGTRDELTGLQNQNQWKAAQPRIDADPNLHVARLDIDGLKAVNDLYSHAEGDKYIAQAGKIIGEEASRAGVSPRMQFRSGTGDEFTLAGSKESVQKATNVIQRRIAAEIELPDAKKGSISAGIGPTEKRADALMYSQKRAGKFAAAKAPTVAPALTEADKLKKRLLERKAEKEKAAKNAQAETPKVSAPKAKGKAPSKAAEPQVARPVSEVAGKPRDYQAIGKAHGGIHPASVEKFYKAFDAVRDAVTNNQKATQIKAIRELAEVLWTGNKNLRKLFAKETGVTLPNASGARSKALNEWMRSGASVAKPAENIPQNIPEPAKGAKAVAQRIVNAEERFIEFAREATGITRMQALRALESYRKNKAIKIDPIGGQFSFTREEFAEPEVIRRAAGIEQEATLSAKPAQRQAVPETPATKRKRLAADLKAELAKMPSELSWAGAETSVEAANQPAVFTWRERRGYLVANPGALYTLNRVRDIKGQSVRGLTFNRTTAEQFIRRAENRARESTGLERENYLAVADALRVASSQREEFAVVPSLGVRTRGTARHELTHVAQMALERFFDNAPNPREIVTLPNYERAAKALMQKGYPSIYGPRVLAHEAFAHIAGGQRDTLGLSLKEAVDFSEGYMKLLARTYKADALKRFDALNAELARLRDAIREEIGIEEKEAGTAAAESGAQGVSRVSERRAQGVNQGVREGGAPFEEIVKQTDTPEFKKRLTERARLLDVSPEELSNVRLDDRSLGLLLSNADRDIIEQVEGSDELNPEEYRRSVRPIVVDSSDNIIDGYHRAEGLRAWARRNGVDIDELEVPVVEIPEKIADRYYDRSMSDERLTALVDQARESAIGNRGTFDPNDPNILAEIADSYSAIPLPPRVKELLSEMSRSYIQEGRTDIDGLIDEFEEMLGDQFDKVSDFLPEIFGREEERAKLTPTPPGEASPQEQHEKQIQASDSTEEAARRERLYKSRAPRYPTSEGAQTTVAIPGSGKEIPAHYQVRELVDVYPSHSAFNFEPNSDYELVDDRRYDREKAYQQEIVQNSKLETFSPNRLINNSDTAEVGPPVIDSNGNVLGGNSRTIMLARYYAAGHGDNYKAELLRQAPVYGLDVKELLGQHFKQPVLVRLMTDETLSKQQLITDLNITGTRALTPQERAIAESNAMPDETVAFLARKIDAEGEDATLSSVLDKSGPDIVNRLIDDGVFQPQERNGLLKDGKILPEAKTRIERLMMARIFRDLDQMDRTPPILKRNLERITASLVTLSGIPEWDIAPEVQNAIDLVTEARAAGIPKLTEFVRQGSMFATRAYTPREIILGNALQMGVLKTARAFKAYANDALQAQNGGGLFGAPAVEDSFANAFEPKGGSRRVTSGSTNLEPGGQGGLTNLLRQENVPAESGSTDIGTRTRVGETGETGLRSESGTSRAGSGAAINGAPRDQQVSGEEPTVHPGVAGSEQPTGHDYFGEPVVPVDHTPTSAVSATAEGDLLDPKRREQLEANKIGVLLGNLHNIRETLPFLRPAQQEDVDKAERQFAEPDGYGMLFTNGTGTGKTYTGLGIVRRFVSRGKDAVIIVVPSDNIAKDWIDSGKNLGLDIKQLQSTDENGHSGVVITTYANFGQNNSLAKRDWDLVVTDESHYLSSNAEGDLTLAGDTLRALTIHPDGVYKRSQMLHPGLHARIEAANRAKAYKEADVLYKELKKLEEPLRAQFDTIAPEERPRVLMLSATPFAYDKSVRYAQGFLFDWNEGHTQRSGYNAPSAESAFFMTNFGYRMRYGKLTRPEADVNTQIMEQQFNTTLKKAGVLSGRSLDVDADYDRKFVLVEDAIGTKIDEGMEFLREAYEGKYFPLYQAMQANFKYHQRMYLLESLRARQVVPLIKKNLALGQKVVVFHDFNKGGGFHPFSFPKSETEISYRVGKQDVKIKIKDLVDQFEAERPDLAKLDFANLPSPLAAMRNAFPNALFVNGLESVNDRREAKRKFNDDNSGYNLIVVQSDAGREGISLHDTTGKHPRVLYNLGMPVKPTAATQIEGRIYRIGQVSDAVFRYLTTGTNWERWTFSQKIAQRASTAENLALGEDARTLKQSFIDAYLDPEHDYEPSLDEGKGGKEADRARAQALTEFERAKTFYFGRQKKTSRTKAQEGTDYFATPEPLGLKMVEWANVKPNEKILEPSAGHGAVARFFPENTDRTVIEPSTELVTRAGLVAGGAQMINDRFENHHLVNKYDAIVMNPPFGVGGKTAIEHLALAAEHLRDGGRIVALLPEGTMADKRLDQFYENEASANLFRIADIKLAPVTFERAGTSVRAHVVVLEKQTDAARAAKLQETNRDYSDAKTINELFDGIEHLSIPDRIPVSAQPKPETALTGETGPGVSEDTFTTAEFVHTKTGKTMYVAKIAKRVSDEEYKAIAKAAKIYGGYYSKYKSGGAIAGMLFPSAEARQGFIDSMKPKERRVAKTEAEARAQSPASTTLPRMGGAPTGLADWFRNRRNAITGQFTGLPTDYTGLVGGAGKSVATGWDKFKNLFVRNLSHLERTSPEAYKFALRAGGSRGQATVLLQLAANKIDQELQGSGISWPMVRAALVESRLRGIRERYLDLAQTAFDADDEELADAFENGMADILKHIEGRAGLDDTLAQRAVAMLANEDFNELRDFLGATFEIAADNVGRVNMGPDPNAFEKLTARPAFNRALRLYKDLMEGPIAESHATNEGVFSDALGPFNTYYPLIAVKEGGGILHRLFGVTKIPYRKPKNIANAFATGLASHGYSLEMTDFAERIKAAIRVNNKAALLSELDAQGLIRVLGRNERAPGTGGTYEMDIDGQMVGAQLVDTGSDLLIVRPGEGNIRIPGARALIPNWLAKELKPILDREKIEPGMGDALVNRIIQASLIGPMDLTWHSFNIIGTLVANTPFIGRSIPSAIIGGTPLTKLFASVLQIIRTNPTTEESITDLTEMANLGLVPPRFGSVTYSRRYAELTGAKHSMFGAGPLLYGPKGLDVRARLVMWRVAKRMNPGATPAQLFKFVNQLGVYNRELESQVERWAKATRLAPFATAGMTMWRNGINAWLGTGPKPVGSAGKKAAYWTAQQLSGGAIGLIALWALAYKAYKKKWPWEDSEARLLQIPLNQTDRDSKIGKILYGPDPTKTAYVNFAFFSPLVSRGSRALGIAGAFDTRALGGSSGQQMEYAQRDIYNSLLHPFTTGPLVRAPFTFLTGKEPSLTSLRDITGQFGPQFYPATVKAAPGLPTLGRRAEEAILNINPFAKATAGAFGIGEKGEQIQRQQQSRWARMLTDIAAPQLIGSAVDTVKAKERIAKEQKAATSHSAPEAKLPDDVRMEMHQIELTPSKPQRKKDESDADYLKRSENAAEGVATRVKALLSSDSYKAMNKEQKKETLQRIIKDERHDLSAAPKGQSEAEKTLMLNRNVVEDRLRVMLESRDEYQSLSEDQQKQVMRKLGESFRMFSIPENLPAAFKEKRAEKAQEMLRARESRGVFDKAIDRLLVGIRRKAA